MADVVLSYTIPEGKVAGYVSDYCYVHKNTEKDENGEAKYTDAQWVREHILRKIKFEIRRGQQAKYRDAVPNIDVDDVT